MNDAFHPVWLPWLIALGLLVALIALLIHRKRRLMRAQTLAASEKPGSSQLGSDELISLASLTAAWMWKADIRQRFVILTDGFTAATGLPVRWALGKQPWSLDWHPVEIDGWKRFRKALKTGEESRLILRRERDGRTHYFELIATPRFDEDVCVAHLGVGRDITEAVESERALSESRAMYHDVMNSVREIVFRADHEGRLTLLNQAWETISNHRIADSIGQLLTTFFHPDDRLAAEAGLKQVLAGTLPEYHASLRLHKRNGEIGWMELSLRRFDRSASAGDNRPELVGTMDDISGRKIAEMTMRNLNQELEARVRARTLELEASNRELEAFSYSVSHDLRAPLRAIDGFARIIEEDLGERLDAVSRDHLERIRNAAARMSYLSDKLIELARFSRHALKRETVDLSAMSIQVIEELRAQAPARKVEFEVTADLMAVVDRTLIRVVFENLLHNAWKFTATRECAQISFTAAVQDAQRVFCIGDNGVGFDMQFAANLFRPFYRLHENTAFEGSGIGLANVQRIIERHGGKIWVEAAPDEGARFYFTLSA